MKFKQYKGASGTGYRVQPCGKVEVQYRPGGRWVHDKKLTAAKLNHWRKSGIITRVYGSGHQTDKQRITARLEAIEEAIRFLSAEELRQWIPVHPNGLIVYERRAMQSVKGDPLTVRGFDEWGAEQGLSRVNSGLSVAAHLEQRERVIRREQIALLAKVNRLP